MRPMQGPKRWCWSKARWRLRPETARDATLATREIEVQVTDLQVVGPAVTPAIPVARKEGEELPARSCGSSIGCSTCAVPSCRPT